MQMNLKDLNLFSELTDSSAEMIVGGAANPENNGNGSVSGLNGLESIDNSTSTFDVSPNNPKYEEIGGVSNADHYFQTIGLIGNS